MDRYRSLVLILVCTCVLALALLPTCPARAGVTILVSVSSDGVQGDKGSGWPALSGDGQYVVFESPATTLVTGDTNGRKDIFVHDRRTGKTVRVSVPSDGRQGKGGGAYPAISEDGRYVAFQSGDDSLVAGDTNGKTDVFVHDRETGETTMVSVSSNGQQGDKASKLASMSAHGRYVAFYSDATDLVPGDTNQRSDIFLHDRQTGKTTRVSVASDGTEGNGASSFPSISGDGQRVAFWSTASNLAPDDTNGATDIFVHDLRTGKTIRVSVASDGTQADVGMCRRAAISADGRYVTFYSGATNLVAGDTNKTSDVFVHDLETGKTIRASVASDGTQANGWSRGPKIGGDGRYVAFQSVATNLVPNDTNGHTDIFVHDCQTGETTRVSVASDGTQGNRVSLCAAISADGRCVAFHSKATNLVAEDVNGKTDVFVYDPETGVTILVSVSSEGDQGDRASKRPAISGDGRYVAFDSNATTLVADDTNRGGDIFVYDRQTGKTTRVSVASDGTQGRGASPYPSISEDGRCVAFHSGDSSLAPGDTNGKTDVFVHDRETGETTMASVASNGEQGNAASKYPSLSGDGRYVAFESSASSLVPGDANGQIDVFVRDRQTGKTTRVSVASDGAEGNGISRYPSISRDGRYVAFLSRASNLVAGDTNEQVDMFVHDRQTAKTTRASVASDGTQADAGTSRGAISGDGRYVTFYSSATNLVPGDTNETSDVFVHDLQTGKTTRASVTSDGTQANGASRRPKISGDGRYVVFWSLATNLVPDDTNGTNDIFVHDCQTGKTVRVSVAGDGAQGDGKSGYPSISADGRWVAFQSGATNLVADDENGKTDVFAHEVQMGDAD